MRRLTEVALFTDDVAAVSSFYHSLAGSPPVAEWPGGAVFAVGDVRILVHERAAAPDGGPPNEDHFAVSVADLGAACDALRADGSEVLVEPTRLPVGTLRVPAGPGRAPGRARAGLTQATRSAVP